MPRNMSFALTTEQFLDRSKTVTRRLGWKFLKPGDEVMGCKKCMGLKPGEKIERLGLIRVVDVKREPLCSIRNYPSDCAKEGFPNMSPGEFIRMFTAHMKVPTFEFVTRIEFEYVEAKDA